MLVARAALQSCGRLSELQIETCTPTPVCSWVCSSLKHDDSLIQADGVAAYVVGPQNVHPSDGVVEVVGIIRVHHDVGGCSFEIVEDSTVLLCEHERIRRRRLTLLLCRRLCC